jgi:hypothetical protein
MQVLVIPDAEITQRLRDLFGWALMARQKCL